MAPETVHTFGLEFALQTSAPGDAANVPGAGRPVEEVIVADDTAPRVPYRKTAVPNAARRELALKFDCHPGTSKWVTCAWCSATGQIAWRGSWVMFWRLEIDHILPEFRGGTHHVDNLTLACSKCNRGRRDRTVDEWRAK